MERIINKYNKKNGLIRSGIKPQKGLKLMCEEIIPLQKGKSQYGSAYLVGQTIPLNPSTHLLEHIRGCIHRHGEMIKMGLISGLKERRLVDE